MKDYNKIKTEQLGKSQSNLMVHIKRNLLFNYVKQAGDSICIRCNKEIMSSEELSIDHIEPWLHKENALELFTDMSNIGFSHKKCNYAHTRQNITRKNKLGLKGVVEVKRSKKPNTYQALIHKNRKQFYLGTFNTPVEAAIVWDNKAIELYGDRAITNKSLGLINY